MTNESTVKTQFTPAPWDYVPGDFNSKEEEASGHYTGGIYADGWCIAVMEADAPEPEANANLIAAAPDLYAALELVRVTLKEAGMSLAIGSRADDAMTVALAKARGE